MADHLGDGVERLGELAQDEAVVATDDLHVHKASSAPDEKHGYCYSRNVYIYRIMQPKGTSMVSWVNIFQIEII